MGSEEELSEKEAHQGIQDGLYWILFIPCIPIGKLRFPYLKSQILNCCFIFFLYLISCFNELIFKAKIRLVNMDEKTP